VEKPPGERYEPDVTVLTSPASQRGSDVHRLWLALLTGMIRGHNSAETLIPEHLARPSKPCFPALSVVCCLWHGLHWRSQNVLTGLADAAPIVGAWRRKVHRLEVSRSW
jgi:hypothetical protein